MHILKAPSPRFLSLSLSLSLSPLKLGAHLPKRSSSAGAPRLPDRYAVHPDESVALLDGADGAAVTEDASVVVGSRDTLAVTA